MLMLNVKGATQMDRINCRPVQESLVSRWISSLLFNREFGYLRFQRGKAYEV